MKSKQLILSLALLALLTISCDKSSDRQTDEAFDQHPTWTDGSTNNFLDKQGGDKGQAPVPQLI